MAETTEPRRSTRNKPAETAVPTPVITAKPNASKKRAKEAEEPTEIEKATEDAST